MKFTKVLATTAILASLASSAAAATYATNVRANLRSAPTTDSKILTCVPQYVVVQYKGAADGWAQVTYNGEEGYIRADLLTVASKVSKKKPSARPRISGKAQFRATTNVWLRTGPGSSYPIAGKVKKGKVITVSGTSGSWLCVVVNGVKYYTFGQYYEPNA